MRFSIETSRMNDAMSNEFMQFQKKKHSGMACREFNGKQRGAMISCSLRRKQVIGLTLSGFQ